MTALQRTLALLVALLVLVAADATWRLALNREPPPLPVLPELLPQEVTKLTVAEGDVTIVIESDGIGGYSLVGPVQGRADRSAVRELLGRFLDPVPMTARVDSGNLDRYGLDDQSAVRVTIANDKETLATFNVGNDVGGGATYVRLAGSDDVYLARLGGRRRYERSVAEWRDHMVFAAHPEGIVRIALDRHGDVLAFTRAELGLDARGAAKLGPWTLSGADFPVDQEVAGNLAQVVGNLRASLILAADSGAPLGDPDVTVEIELQSGGGQRRAALVRFQDSALARRDDAPEVYQIAASVVNDLLAPATAFRDRQFLEVDRTDIHRLVLDEEVGSETILEQDAATSQWAVVKPANVDADLREALFTAKTLGNLRVEQVVDLEPGSAGFPSKNRMTIEKVDGSKVTVEFGKGLAGRPQGREAFYVRTSDEPERIGILPAKIVMEMRRAWAR